MQPIKQRMARPRREIDTSTYSGRFAARLRELRDERGLTTRELAEMTGIPKSTIESWESATNEPKIEQLPKIAEAFGISMANLLPKE